MNIYGGEGKRVSMHGIGIGWLYEEHVEKGGVEENRKGPNFLSLHKHESIIIYLQTRRGTAMAIFPTSSSVCIIFLIRTCQIIPR